jgi:hypothetical protein
MRFPAHFPFYRMRRVSLSFSLALLLALLFLLAQAGAVAHEFSHLDEDEGGVAEDCVFCLAAVALDAAAPLPDAPALSLPPLLVAAFALLYVSHFSSPCRAYWGRAPPARLCPQ